MTIAIIIPYHNAAPWLDRCLASIDPRFEVIAVDDNSTDNGPEIVEKYFNSDKVKGLNLINNRAPGVAGARNTGLDFALEYIKPDYIAFLDADDELAPDAYDAMTAAWREKPQAEIIQFQHRRITPDGKAVPRMPCGKGVYNLDRLPPLWVSSVNKLFKTDLIKDISFDTGLRHGEDEVFVLKCLKWARYIFVSEYVTMFYHRDNPNSLSTITDLDDLIGEQRALLELFIDYSDDRALCEAIRQRQCELWNNPTYKRVIGGVK